MIQEDESSCLIMQSHKATNVSVSSELISTEELAANKGKCKDWDMRF